MQHNIYTFFSVYNCLDEEFDAPDIAADHRLCHAIIVGKMGLHPDAWGNHDGLARAPLPARNWDDDFVITARVNEVLPVDPVWEAKHRRRPVEEPPKPKPKPKLKPPPTWYPPPQAWSDPDGGDISLTCDECGRNFGRTLRYPPGLRPSYVRMIRLMGRDQGWTCIVGRDRCPECSQLAAPEAKGNGAGTDQGNEQHA